MIILAVIDYVVSTIPNKTGRNCSKIACVVQVAKPQCPYVPHLFACVTIALQSESSSDGENIPQDAGRSRVERERENTDGE
jgi:hypothetical protein